MLARLASKTVSIASKRLTKTAFPAPAVRKFGWINAPLSTDYTYEEKEGRLFRSDNVVITDTYPSLEWVLENPLGLHQFDEPPLIVEIEHLDNLVAFE